MTRRAPLVFVNLEASQSAAEGPDISAFKPRGAGQGPPAPAVRDAIDQATAYPSREAAPPPAAPEIARQAVPVEGQLNIRASVEVIERFRGLCQEDRRTYADMLQILMDKHEAEAAKPRHR